MRNVWLGRHAQAASYVGHNTPITPARRRASAKVKTPLMPSGLGFPRTQPVITMKAGQHVRWYVMSTVSYTHLTLPTSDLV